MELNVKTYKLEIFIPETHLSALQKALQTSGVGHIGSYDCCLSYSIVTGVWRPLDEARPYIGTPNELCSAPELKIEAICPQENLPDALKAIKSVHPYEQPVINIIPLINLY